MINKIANCNVSIKSLLNKEPQYRNSWKIGKEHKPNSEYYKNAVLLEEMIWSSQRYLDINFIKKLTNLEEWMLLATTQALLQWNVYDLFFLGDFYEAEPSLHGRSFSTLLEQLVKKRFSKIFYCMRVEYWDKLTIEVDLFPIDQIMTDETIDLLYLDYYEINKENLEEITKKAKKRFVEISDKICEIIHRDN